jgi:hypothetical protein
MQLRISNVAPVVVSMHVLKVWLRFGSCANVVLGGSAMAITIASDKVATTQCAGRDISDLCTWNLLV